MLSIVSLSDCTGRIKTSSETRLGCSKGRHNGCEIAVDKSGIVERHKRLREVPFDKFFEELSRIRLDRFEFWEESQREMRENSLVWLSAKNYLSHSVGEAPFIKSYTFKTEKVKVTVKNSKETLVRWYEPRALCSWFTVCLRIVYGIKVRSWIEWCSNDCGKSVR